MRTVAFADHQNGAGTPAAVIHSPALSEPIAPPWQALREAGIVPADGPSPPSRSPILEEIPLDRVQASPHQPRQVFDPAELDDLAASIREHGLLQPIKVTCHAGDGEISYELIFGERRWRAAVQAGLATLPALVVPADEVDEAGRAVQGLIENLHRSDLNPMEILAGLKGLMALTGASWPQLAPLVGKSRRTLYYYRALDQMPPAIQARVASGQLNMKQVDALSAIQDAETQAQLVEAALEKDLSGASLKEIARSVKAGHAVQSAIVRAAPRRPPPLPQPEPEVDEAGPAPTEATAPPRAERTEGRNSWIQVTDLHKAAMGGLSDQQRADLSFEIRERGLEVTDTRHAAAVMRQDPAKSAGAAVTYAQLLRNHSLFEPFKSLDFVLHTIASLARAEQPRAVRTVALAFLAEKEEELRAAIETLRSADSQAR